MMGAEFWRFTAEPAGREPDPLRFQAEAFKYSQDVVKKVKRYTPPMPSTYSDPNIDTQGAISAPSGPR